MSIAFIESELSQAWESVERMFAVITFDPQGNVIDANSLFLNTMGFSDKADVVGQHHRIFCQEAYVASAEYAEFWRKLAAGERVSGAFRRVRKDGSEIFLYAEYAPIRDENGQVIKVLKVAQNVSRIAEGVARQLGINARLADRLMSLELQRDPSAVGSANNA
ncbi:MAG: PAS domain-containing protein [Thiothrix sp.]